VLMWQLDNDLFLNTVTHFHLYRRRAEGRTFLVSATEQEMNRAALGLGFQSPRQYTSEIMEY